MIELNEVQAMLLTQVFEESFEDGHEFFTLIDIEEIFALLLGEEVHQDIYDLLERTSRVDEHNLVMTFFLFQLLEDVVEAVEIAHELHGVEYWELANNCNILKNKLDEILCAPDSGDLS